MGKPLPLTLLRVINPCHLHDPNGMSLPDDINMTLSIGKGFTLLHISRRFYTRSNIGSTAAASTVKHGISVSMALCGDMISGSANDSPDMLSAP
jgi:hypothetical protein